MQSGKPDNTTGSSTRTLRQRAEEMVKNSPNDLSSMSDHDIQRLVNELRIQQVEMELQNQQLREAQTSEIELTAKALANLGEGVLITTDHQDWLASRIVFANKALCGMLGYSAEKILQLSPGLMLGESIDPATQQNLQAQLLASQSFRGELVYSHQDGDRRDIELLVSPVVDSKQCTNYVAVARDITERKRAQQLLRERKERLRSIFNTVPDGIITIDLDGIVQECNSATERLFGFSEEELVGQNIALLMPSPHREAHGSYLRRHRETGESNILGTRRPLFGQHRDGHQFPIVLAVNAIDHLGLYLGVIQDVSELRQLQQDVLRAADEVQWRIGQALHDGPQQALAGLSLLSRGLVLDLRQLASPLEPQALRLSTGLKEANDAIRRLARGLVPVFVGNEGLNSALRRLAQQASEDHGIHCELFCPESIQICDRYTADQLYHITQEATLNAVNHSGANRISIRLERLREQLMLRVLDNGSGFNRNDKVNSGLGMHIMPYRAATIGAELKVIPADGGGTEVCCTLIYPDDDTSPAH